MRIRQKAVCRADGKVYVLIASSVTCSWKDSAIRAIASGVSIPAGIYPFGENKDACAQWVLELPVVEAAFADVHIVLAGESSSLRVVYELAKWQSRLNYRMKSDLCAQVRCFERRFLDNRFQLQVERGLRKNNAVVWRTVISWKGDSEVKPSIAVSDGRGNQLDATQYFFEFQPALAAQPDSSNSLHLSIELPLHCKYFIFEATDAEGAFASGFCCVCLETYNGHLNAALHHMKDAMADDNAYKRWFESTKAQLGQLDVQRSQVFEYAPKISVIVTCCKSNAKHLRQTIDSLVGQTYSNWELLLLDASPEVRRVYDAIQNCRDGRVKYIETQVSDGVTSIANVGVMASSGEFVAFLGDEDILEPDALFWYVHAINQHREVKVLYCDEDSFEKIGQWKQPSFKSDFNVDLLYAYDYVAHFLMVQKQLLLTMGLPGQDVAGAQNYDIVLKAYAMGAKIHHVSRMLYHCRDCALSTNAKNAVSESSAHEAGKLALQRHFDQRGIAGTVEDGAKSYEYRMRYQLPSPLPLVSVIIPSKDHTDVLDACVTSLMEKASYSNLEILVIENNSINPMTFDYYRSLSQRYECVRVIRWEYEFNYSKIINFGASHATGDYLLLLNNDTEVISPDFIEEMMGYLQRPEVGVVGAKLLFRDGLVQHAGVQVGPFDAAVHVNQDFSAECPGYLDRAILPSNFSAVTGACQLVKRQAFDAVNGYDEQFVVGFNDIDFCMRLAQAGYLTVFSPYALLYHYEFVSRGREEGDPEKLERWKGEQALIMSRWPDPFIKGDPFANPNLKRNNAYYALPDC